jgi:hypothetical protein
MCSLEPVKIRIHYTVNEPILAPRIALHIADSYGRVLAHISNAHSGSLNNIDTNGFCDVTIHSLPLVPGIYTIMAKAADAFGSVVYDNGLMVRELVILPPYRSNNSGAVRFGQVWIDSDWTYHNIGDMVH